MDLDHLISKSIKSNCKNRLITPIVYLVILLLIAVVFPVFSIIIPKSYDAIFDIRRAYESRETYGYFTLDNLRFTGYSSAGSDRTNGYYYYTQIGEDLVLVLMSPSACEYGKPLIDSIKIKGRIVVRGDSVDQLLGYLSKDLKWGGDGIFDAVSPYMISQPDADRVSLQLFKYLYIFSGLYALCNIAALILFMLKPDMSPNVRRLMAYGNPKVMLEDAQKELSTLPQLATEDMFITEHYFIETSRNGVAFVPISEIRWVYKYSTMHMLLGRHLGITYTLYISANKNVYIKCPRNYKSDIDGIMDYLAEANHNILVGFTEENRLAVEGPSQINMFLRRLLGLLNKRI